MRIAVSGTTGLIGGALVQRLAGQDHEVFKLVRKPLSAPSQEHDIHWLPENGAIDAKKLEGMGAVVHLAGETIAERWTEEKKKRIVESRVKGTQTLCGALAKLEKKPRVLVSASAVGVYGDRGAEELTEQSATGKGFLADVCRSWEAATAPALAAGIRVVNLRVGIVVAKEGGALSKMMTPFKLGVGGRIGSGKQYMSWVSLRDILRMIEHAIGTPALSGPLNAVGPAAVTNAEFAAALGKALRRPAAVPLPAFAARLVMGREAADEMLLSGARVVPAKLKETGFEWREATLEAAIAEALK
jgi:uncharacterized protein (TIGR01777 family)